VREVAGSRSDPISVYSSGTSGQAQGKIGDRNNKTMTNVLACIVFFTIFNGGEAMGGGGKVTGKGKNLSNFVAVNCP
jgi:hypothetical protein